VNGESLFVFEKNCNNKKLQFDTSLRVTYKRNSSGYFEVYEITKNM